MSSQHLYVDILDLINYLSVHSRPSGIQRVVIEFIKNSAGKSTSIIPCRINEQGIFVTYKFDHLIELIDIIKKEGDNHNDIKHQLQTLMSHESSQSPKRGDVYIVLGAFWIAGRQHDWQHRLRKRGVIVVTFIHDLIPLSHPDLVTTTTRNYYEKSLALIAQQTDLFICNSKYTEQALKSTLLRELEFMPNTAVATLGSDPVQSSAASLPIPLEEGNFVLAVGTREIRKNHIIAVRAWATLLRKHTLEHDVPYLVIVGRPGWKADLLNEFVEDSPIMQRKVIFLEDVDEKDLIALYSKCLFTIFPSFVEGWGLPITESLIHGKVCIAGNGGAQTEAGGDLAIYVDPRDYQGLYRQVRDLLNSELRSEIENRIKQNYVPHTWQSFTEDVWAAFSNITNTNSNIGSFKGFKAEINKIYSLSSLDISNDICMSWVDRGRVFCLDENWNELEDWGCWSSAENAGLEIPTNAQPGDKLRLLLELRFPPPPHPDDMDMTIEVDGLHKHPIAKTELGPEWISLFAYVDQNRKINLTLSRKSFFSNPHRQLYVGISKFCLFEATIREEDIQKVLSE
ncbi:glycosyltransferase family 4 protein [Methylobacterium sp. Gmos1]